MIGETVLIPEPRPELHPKASSESYRESLPEPSKTEDGQGPAPAATPTPAPREIGGRDGPDPTRYGDWEKNGRCIDF
ncbi:MAG: DUF1674 domain-containing protein [Pseudomonadota bacterium]